jgi:DNA-binding transcriptional MerR regulator
MDKGRSFPHYDPIVDKLLYPAGTALCIFTARYLMAFINFYQLSSYNMDRNSSQITFEFSGVPADEATIPSVGVRVKSLKSDTEAVEIAEPVKEEEAAIETAAVVQVQQEVVTVKKSTRGRKSLKALDAEADLVNIPGDEILFQRQYYSIGEVADMFRVNQSLLRFWENEFDIIQPRKNRKGDRHFRPIDIKNLELIYDLLRRRKLTIEGAKDFLKKNSKAKEHFEMIQSLQSLKGFLLEIKAAL